MKRRIIVKEKELKRHWNQKKALRQKRLYRDERIRFNKLVQGSRRKVKKTGLLDESEVTTFEKLIEKEPDELMRVTRYDPISKK